MSSAAGEPKKGDSSRLGRGEDAEALWERFELLGLGVREREREEQIKAAGGNGLKWGGAQVCRSRKGRSRKR